MSRFSSCRIYTLLILLLVLLVGTLPCPAQTNSAQTNSAQTTTPTTPTPVDSTEKYFVMTGGGWGPATGGRGEGAVGLRIGTGIYSLTTMNLAGGVGAVVEDVLYRAATSRGVTLWGRAGAGASTTNNGLETSTTPTFGGGLMLTYDLSKVSTKLSGLEAYMTAKAMYVTDTTSTTTNSTVRSQYLIGLKFNWMGN